MERTIGEYVRSALTLFGCEVNTKRQLPSVWDGLKPSYRHILYEELRTGPKMRKSVDIIGSCLSTTHPHGDASLQSPLSNLVRWGISKGQGNHGKKRLIGEDTEPSAMRYTEARISDKWFKIFDELLPYVPHQEAEVSGSEPIYLPTILPLCLVFGGQGLGLGVNCRIPAFTPESLMNAYFNNDPSLLVGNFGLEINYDKSELEKLWTTGVGKVCYKFKVYNEQVEGNWGVCLEGNPELFKPNLNKINKWVKQEKAFILDMTNRNATKIFVSREYNIRSISFDDIKNELITSAENCKTYRLTVADDNQAYLIPMYDWIDKTVKNYASVIETYKKSKIRKLNGELEVYKNLDVVVDALMRDRDSTPESLSKVTGVSLPTVKAILSKSINTLRNADSQSKIKSIESEIKKFSGIDAMTKIKEMADELQNP